MKYFNPIPTTCEELKQAFRAACKVHHPDKGGSTVAMQELNAEYDRLFAKLKKTVIINHFVIQALDFSYPHTTKTIDVLRLMCLVLLQNRHNFGGKFQGAVTCASFQTVRIYPFFGGIQRIAV
jgi:hypothetical protein